MDEQPDVPPSTPPAAPPRRKKRWWVRALVPPVLLGLILGLLAAPMACTATIYPPVDPSQPVPVFLLDHGRTPSLVLPDVGGGMVRYSYGDWNYYALGNRGFLDSVLALFWPTQGALGRLELQGPMTLETIRAELGVGFENAYRIEVPRQQVEQLRTELEALFQRNIDTLVHNPGADFHFVHHPDSYTYFHNSNHVVAAWLERLGAEVKGPTYYSTWEIAGTTPE